MGPAWHSRRPHQCTAVLEYGPTEILPPVGAISKHPARLCRPGRQAGRAHPRRKPGFSTLESGCGRETDCLLEGDGFEPSVPGTKQPVFVVEGKLRGPNRGNQKGLFLMRYRWFESISLQQTVRVSPRPGRYRSKNPRFRAGVRRCGPAETRSTRRNRANRRRYLCRAIFQYRSATDVIGQRRPRPSPSSGSGQFLKQSQAGRVAPAIPAADVSGRAACLP